MSHVLFPEPDCEHVDGSFIIVESQCYKIYSLEFKKYFIFFKEERTQFLVVEVSMGLIYKRMLAGT